MNLIEKYYNNRLTDYYKHIRNKLENSSVIRENNKIIEVVKFIENEISLINDDVKLAFPIGININDTIAHFSPDYDDIRIFNENDLIKIDFGIHIDGCIIDSSRTYTISNEDSLENKMISTCKEACNEAIKNIKSETYIPDVSNLIEEIILSNDFYPIEELCGHEIDQYKIHNKLVIPNIKCDEFLPNHMRRIKNNCIYAIEPFLSNKKTKIYGDLDNISHYMFNYHRYDIKLLKKLPYINNNYKTLCFDIKWLKNKISEKEIYEIINSNLVTPYPPLKCVDNKIKTAHYEETIFVNDNKSIILS